MLPALRARPEKRRDQMTTLAIEEQKWMVHVLTVIAVVEGAFLISVYRIVGRVEVKEYLLWSTVLATLPQVKFKECLGYSMAGSPGRRILQAGDGRLARQVLSALGL